MHTKRIIAALELLLVFPGALFMTALFVRNIQPPSYEPAQTAGRLVDWFAARPHLGLHVSLMALPFAAFVIGCTAVLHGWRSDDQLRRATLEAVAGVRTHLAALLIAVATLVAAGILAIVAVHVVTD